MTYHDARPDCCWRKQVWLKPGDELGDSLFTYWKNVVLPPVAGLDFSVVFSKGYRGTTLLDKNLVDSYDQFLTSLVRYPVGGLRHYLWADFMQSGLKGSALLERILNERNGSSSILQAPCCRPFRRCVIIDFVAVSHTCMQLKPSFPEF